MKRPKIEFETSEGVKYQIVWRKITKNDLKGCRASAAYGLCFSPDSKNPKIIIDPDLTDTKTLEILIHECSHSFFWDKNEKEIGKFSRILSKIIYMLGWKLIK